MIIVEGPDRVGKSTVCQVLREYLHGWSYRHHTKPPVRPFSYFGWTFADSHPRMIIDRAWWSEFAYGLAYRGKSDLTNHEWRLLELMGLTLGASVLLISDSYQGIKSRWSDQEMFPVEGMQKVCLHMDQLNLGIASQRSYLHRINPEKPYTYTDLIKETSTGPKPTDELLKIIEQERQRCWERERLLPPSVGCGEICEFMVVGESPGTQEIKDDLGPHVPLDVGRAAEFMWSKFDELKLQWWKGYYTNASAFEGPQAFADYVNVQVRPKKILCLGKIASQLVSHARMGFGSVLRKDIEIIEVEHPMYVRRFSYHDSDAWVNKIREGLADYVSTP